MDLCGKEVGPDRGIFFIAGACVIESEAHTLAVVARLRAIADRLGLLLIYKSSFDKANRSSGTSFRGPGIEEGLRILEKVRAETGLPVLTDVHTGEQVTMVARGALAQKQVTKSDVRRSHAKLFKSVSDCAQIKAKQMNPLPTHRYLDNTLQLAKGHILAHVDPSPSHGAQAIQPDQTVRRRQLHRSPPPVPRRRGIRIELYAFSHSPGDAIFGRIAPTPTSKWSPAGP